MTRTVKLLSSLALIALAFCMLAALRPAGAQANVVKTNERIPFDAVLDFPLECPGEPVHVTDEFHRVTTVTTDSREGFFQLGGFHYRSTDNFNLEGVGLVTGTRYRFVGAGTQVMQRGTDQGADVDNTTATIGLISQGRGDNLVLHLNTHTTINSNGEVTSTVLNEKIVCQAD